MILIVGLGNPGKKFQKTRHNMGFRVIDQFAKKYNFPDFKLIKEFKAEISEGALGDKKIILEKPQTFMNLSGKAVKNLLKTYNLKPNNLIIVHDDIDLPLGKIRISKDRGAAGHKGVESIIRELKTKNFVRFRVGINQFAQNQKSKIKNQKFDEFVLKKITKEEEKIVKEVVKKTVEAVEVAIKEGVEKAMTEFNK